MQACACVIVPVGVCVCLHAAQKPLKKSSQDVLKTLGKPLPLAECQFPRLAELKELDQRFLLRGREGGSGGVGWCGSDR